MKAVLTEYEIISHLNCYFAEQNSQQLKFKVYHQNIMSHEHRTIETWIHMPYALCSVLAHTQQTYSISITKWNGKEDKKIECQHVWLWSRVNEYTYVWYIYVCGRRSTLLKCK